MAVVKWGVIGSGGIARRRTIPEGIVTASNAELTAVMDVDAGVNEEVACEFGAKACADVEALLGRADVQAVYIATPVSLHLKQACAALAAGKHVLLEKPLAATVADAEAIARAAAAAAMPGRPHTSS